MTTLVAAPCPMVGTAPKAPLPTLQFGTPLRLVAAFLAPGFEQEPGAALGLVDEDFEQARGAGILMIVAKLVRLAHRGGDVFVVFHQLAQHFARRHVALVVVLDGLQFCDLPDRAHRDAADLANALGQKALKTIPHVKIRWRNARTADPTMEARLTLPRLLPHH